MKDNHKFYLWLVTSVIRHLVNILLCLKEFYEKLLQTKEIDVNDETGDTCEDAEEEVVGAVKIVAHFYNNIIIKIINILHN